MINNFLSNKVSPFWRIFIILTNDILLLNLSLYFSYYLRIEYFLSVSSMVQCTQMQHSMICHQANLSMLEFITKNLSIPSNMHLYNVDQYGNCGGASAPSVLSQNWERFKSGDEIGLSVVGTGLTWGATHIRVQQREN